MKFLSAVLALIAVLAIAPLPLSSAPNSEAIGAFIVPRDDSPVVRAIFAVAKRGMAQPEIYDYGIVRTATFEWEGRSGTAFAYGSRWILWGWESSDESR